MEHVNVSHGKIKMNKIVSRRELPCPVVHCLRTESESFVVRNQCQREKKKKKKKKKK
jgi:hypothetical protein